MSAATLNILLLGSGGREHALAWKIAQSPLMGKLWCMPGNAGIAQVAECVDASDPVTFCREHAIDLVVIGPEQPLVDGVSDALRAAGIAVFGCSQYAAQLEGSKGFTKDLCRKYGIPTGDYERFDSAAPAEDYIRRMGAPIVVKADGLAAGKGVTVAQTVDEAIAAVREVFGGKFGTAGSSVVVEEFLAGEEASFFALSDGTSVRPFGAAQDHKTVGEGDTGPNTGGMGTYSPAPIFDDAMQQKVMDNIITPTIAAMRAEGHPFTGVLFAGLMISPAGEPKLIEYNVRFGDPETQVLMARLESDIVPLLLACAKGHGLEQCDIAFRPDAALCVVMAAKGYPGDYVKGTVIRGLRDVSDLPDAQVFHAGTALQDGKTVATGGRVLGVTAIAPSVAEAQKRAYAVVDRIDWPEGFCRRDIGWRALKV
jgi:phosphoribosylamine---glycine ligase